MNNIKLSSISHTLITPLKQTNSVKDALNSMKENSISSVIIVDDADLPIGIFTERDAITIIANEQKNSLYLSDVMSKDVFYLKEDSYIHDAYTLMEQKGFRHIIVVDENNRYIGVVSEGDFLRHMGFEELPATKSIKDAMIDSILTINLNTSLTEVALRMSKKKCDYAIIVEHNQPIGVIGERDIAHCSIDGNLSLENAMSIMKHQTMCLVNIETSLQDVSQMMKEHGVHQLVVVNNTNALIGLITRHDILKTIHSSYFDYLLKTIESKSEKEQTLIKHKKELKKIANCDSLTNLPNRLFFKRELKKLVTQSIKNQQISAVLMLDLDRFKDINDSYGHSIGDEILSIISSRLVDIVKVDDLVARLGGDEFAIILEDVDSKDEIVKITNNILLAISKACKLSNGIDIHIASSIGIVLVPDDAKNVEEIFQYADSALYQAKSDGRGIYSFYTDEMTKKAMQKIAYESELRQAITNNELELYYQPQVYMKTGKIVSCEALLRWDNHKFGRVTPDIFIPIAEDTGLINSIGEWVINEACTQGKIWVDKGYHLTIAVNVSPNQVRYQNLPLVISEALKKSGYSASRLEVEITESSLMQREEEVVEMLHSLRAKGIRLAIDDFGTGYSSLSYLKRFPIDVLKIDKSFIDDIPYEKDDMAIVVAIIEMGKALGFEVLAEGTEHKEQLDFLEERGCNLYQGYIKSKPLPAKEFEKLLEEQNF
ncbi:MAG: EAL domain-containing protein [Campylobacterota bacterium]|nr:EAL domain-containing protein [Campylobacterota bacterium]